jgi:hypothetical protein
MEEDQQLAVPADDSASIKYSGKIAHHHLFGFGWQAFGYVGGMIGILFYISIFNQWSPLIIAAFFTINVVIALVRTMRERARSEISRVIEIDKHGIFLHNLRGTPTHLNAHSVQAAFSILTESGKDMVLQSGNDIWEIPMDKRSHRKQARQALEIESERFGNLVWYETPFRWQTFVYHLTLFFVLVPSVSFLANFLSPVLGLLALLVGPWLLSKPFLAFHRKRAGIGRERMSLGYNRIHFASQDLTVRYSDIESIEVSGNTWKVHTHDSSTPLDIDVEGTNPFEFREEQESIAVMLRGLVKQFHSQEMQKVRISDQVRDWARQLRQPELPWGFNLSEVKKLLLTDNYRDHLIREQHLWEVLQSPDALPDEQALAAHLLMLQEPHSSELIKQRIMELPDHDARQQVYESIQCAERRNQ